MKLSKLGICGLISLLSYTAMEWLCNVGYTCFPWVAGADSSHFQNRMHLAVTVLVVVCSLAAMLIGPMGMYLFLGKFDEKRD